MRFCAGPGYVDALAVHYDFYYIDEVLSSFRYTPISLTSTMHSGGSDMEVFYHITRKSWPTRTR